MRLAVTSLASAVLAAGCLAQNSAVSREGPYWVETTAGVAALDAAGVLQVTTPGPVVLEGESRGNLSYVLRKRVRARDAAEAKLRLGKMAVKEVRAGGGLTLNVIVPAASGARASLRLAVPRTLREVAVESAGDTLEAANLDGAFRADSSGGRIHLDRIQGDVVVRTGGGIVRLGKMGGNVLCFSGGGAIVADSIGGEAGLNTAGGEISVRWVKGLVRAVTSGGNIRIERAERGVTATVGSGLIDIMQAGGPVVAHTETGSIKVRSAGDIECQAESGAIQLIDVFGGVRASTRSGSIVADLAGKPMQDSAFSTAAGDITVLIPSNLAVTVETIGSYPGVPRVISDFREMRPRDGQNEMQGAINGGGPRLRLTASGTIYLRRQK